MATTSTSASTSAPAATGTTTGRSKRKKVVKKKGDPGLFAGITLALFLIALLLYLLNGPTILGPDKKELPEEMMQAIRYTVLGWTLLLSFLIGLVSVGGAYAIALKDGKIDESETKRSITFVCAIFFSIAATLLFAAWISTKAFDFMRGYIQAITAFLFVLSLLIGLVVYIINHKKGDSKAGLALALLVLLIIVLAGFKSLNRGAEILKQGPPKISTAQPAAPTDVKKVTVDVDVNVHKNETVTKVTKVVEEPATLKVPPMDWSDFQQKLEKEAANKPKGHLY